MSVEDLKKYGQMCIEDEDLKAKAKTMELDIDKHIAHGKELGLEFTVEDFKALGEETGFSEDELTEEQLAALG
jgi:predicted ribosomally synthesized peptide with nif11-like leader